MIVEFYTPGRRLLLSRQQEALPVENQRILWRKRSGLEHYYRVAYVEWPLEEPPAGQQYYSPTDAAKVVVRVWLREEEHA